jgi:hypothetical protein
MEALSSSEASFFTSVIQLNIPEDVILQPCLCRIICGGAMNDVTFEQTATGDSLCVCVCVCVCVLSVLAASLAYSSVSGLPLLRPCVRSSMWPSLRPVSAAVTRVPPRDIGWARTELRLR